MVTQLSSSQPTWLTIIYLLRWHKPAGRLILMLPALWAVFLSARGNPPWILVGIIILGSLATSALGCVVNDLWDRDIDPQVERTKNRPLASKTLSLQVGWAVALVALLSAGGLALYLNPLSFSLCLGAVPLIIAYPLAKRFFPLPQLVLSLTWGFAVLISWTAVEANLELGTWELWTATVLWTLGFDTIYALADQEDDRRIGINSSALFFGDFAPWAIGLCFMGTLIALGTLGLSLNLNAFYGGSLAIAALAWGWQVYRLQQPTLERETYGALFGQNVWIGFGLLGGMIVGCI